MSWWRCTDSASARCGPARAGACAAVPQCAVPQVVAQLSGADALLFGSTQVLPLRQCFRVPPPSPESVRVPPFCTYGRLSHKPAGAGLQEAFGLAPLEAAAVRPRYDATCPPIGPCLRSLQPPLACERACVPVRACACLCVPVRPVAPDCSAWCPGCGPPGRRARLVPPAAVDGARLAPVRLGSPRAPLPRQRRASIGRGSLTHGSVGRNGAIRRDQSRSHTDGPSAPSEQSRWNRQGRSERVEAWKRWFPGRAGGSGSGGVMEQGSLKE